MLERRLREFQRQLFMFSVVFRRYQIAIITTLCIILLLLLFLTTLKDGRWHWPQSQTEFDQLARTVTITKDILYAVAILIGGVWTYYLFVGGRTFKPRITMDADVLIPYDIPSEVVVFRLRIGNVGNTKIVPRKFLVKFSRIRRGETGFEFLELCPFADLLPDYYPIADKFVLEPKEQVMTIDRAVHLPGFSDSTESNILPSMLQVSMVFIDNSIRLWKEERIVTILNTKENTK